MKLIEIRCPNCNGELKVNPEKEKLVCGYCHTEFLVDDEVEKVETHHIITNEAEIKRVESEKEIEMKKLEMEEKKREESKKVSKTITIITIIEVLVCTIALTIASASGNEDHPGYLVGGLALIALMVMWVGRGLSSFRKK